MKTTNSQICHQAEAVAAYLDGELDTVAQIEFENHFATCEKCRASLAVQRQVLCSLAATFRLERDMDLPPDFARIVTAHAQNDMNGVRGGLLNRGMFKRNVRLVVACFMLFVVVLWSFAGVVAESQSMRAAGSVLEMMGRAGRDAGVGFAFVLRGLDELALAGVSPRFAALGWTLFGVAAGLLWLFVRSYRLPRNAVSRFLNHPSSPADEDAPLFD